MDKTGFMISLSGNKKEEQKNWWSRMANDNLDTRPRAYCVNLLIRLIRSLDIIDTFMGQNHISAISKPMYKLDR